MHYTKEPEEDKAIENLLETVKSSRKVTLLYGFQNQEYNQALMLRDFLKKSLCKTAIRS